jgi:mannose-6-phosphate isomerase-like protein (cupin superfamily)
MEVSMLEKATDFQVRRVVHGTGPDGKSTVLEDGLAMHRVETPAFTIVDLWRTNSSPASLANDDGLPPGVDLTPPPGSAVFRMSAIAPDEEWAGRPMSDSLAAIGHDDSAGDAAAAEESGVHATDTLDVVVVLSGEVYCTTDTHETLLKAGDVVVQTGNTHAWSNRSGRVCVVAFLMAGATR